MGSYIEDMVTWRTAIHIAVIEQNAEKLTQCLQKDNSIYFFVFYLFYMPF